MNIIMLQNKLLTFYFELKLQVRGMENISLAEICRLLASCCAVVISTPIMGRFSIMILSMSVRLPACACVPFIALKDEDENLYKFPFKFCKHI